MASLNAFEQKEKKRELKINPGLALIDLRSAGPRKLVTVVFIEED